MSKGRTDVRRAAGSGTEGDYVLPKPRRPVGDLVVSAPTGAVPGYREEEVARAIGERSQALLECQERLLQELGDCLQGFEADLGEATRARLHGRVRSALSVLEWCGAVQADLLAESRWAALGLQPVDLAGFCSAIAAEAAAAGRAVHVAGELPRAWWGDVRLLGEALAAALDLIGARAGTGAGIVLEIQPDGDRAALRVAGLGEARDDIPAAVVDRFRAAADRLGARVTPDALGPGGAGLVLRLPDPAA